MHRKSRVIKLNQSLKVFNSLTLDADIVDKSIIGVYGTPPSSIVARAVVLPIPSSVEL